MKFMAIAFLLLFSVLSPLSRAQDQPIAIVLHGGAGYSSPKTMSEKKQKQYMETMAMALDSAYLILEKGGSSTDAVVCCIRILEDSPLFNAGKGAVLTHQGIAELDASIMEGKFLNAGAISGVRIIKNPVSLARLVMDSSKHVMLSGRGAEQYAQLHSIELVDPEYFITPRRKKLYNKKKADSITPKKHGTVGAVALDQNGLITAATSTGGMMWKEYGRVGDSPIIGAGTYADNSSCGVSCTGHGEYFIRNVVAYDVSAMMNYKGLSLQQAAHEIVQEKLKSQKASGGLIALDKKGNIAMEFNTTAMFRAYRKSDGSREVLLF